MSAPREIPGVVEVFDTVQIRGWITVPAGTPPVRVTLHVNHPEVAWTYASTPLDPAAYIAPDESLQIEERSLPKPFRRNGWKEIRPFHFRLRDLWNFTKRSHRLSVRVDGRPMPIAGHGMYRSPQRNGEYGLDELTRRLSQGWVFAQWGRLQLSKQLDTQWQAQVLGLYQQVREVLREEFGYDPFFVYGTLLGAVREGGFIGHDIDFDCAYLSSATDPLDAARELHEVALALIARGFEVTLNSVSIHVHLGDDPDLRIDVFHLYFDAEGAIAFPFGIAGVSRFTRADWDGLTEIAFPAGHDPAGRGLIPRNAERLVEHIYGPSWRDPKPGFNWRVDRTTAAYESRVPRELLSKVYWTNHSAHAPDAPASALATTLAASPAQPRLVIDFGCGDGADAAVFAAAGCSVIGVDQSPVAVARAAARVPGARFVCCDLSEPKQLDAVLDSIERDGPALFHLRGLLDVVPEDAEAAVLAAVSAAATTGDSLAAEFRVGELPPALSVPQSRGLDAGEVVASLRALGWAIVREDEADGVHLVLATRG